MLALALTAILGFGIWTADGWAAVDRPTFRERDGKRRAVAMTLLVAFVVLLGVSGAANPPL